MSADDTPRFHHVPILWVQTSGVHPLHPTWFPGGVQGLNRRKRFLCSIWLKSLRQILLSSVKLSGFDMEVSKVMGVPPKSSKLLDHDLVLKPMVT